ncbi:MAG: radical SAM protein [Deltaproteobacteria bacterium]|nr:radical SAM protein [Deltaproteobacteria bacterium]
MYRFQTPNPNQLNGLNLVNASLAKNGVLLPPHTIDIHPVSGRCNLDCQWCIGRKGRSSVKPLPQYITSETIVALLEKALLPEEFPLWPSTFHFCGGDSEPLLNPGAVIKGTAFLLEKERIVRLVTNGLALNKPGIAPIVAEMHRLNVSLDVVDDDQFQTFKRPGAGIRYGYQRVLANLERVADLKARRATMLIISVSFVATSATFEDTAWKRCFEQLRDLGVALITVRQDLSGVFGEIYRLKERIDSIAEHVPGVEIKYIAPEVPCAESDFEFCRGPMLWPTLAADGNLYACAHVATSRYRPFANLATASSLMACYRELRDSRSRGFRDVRQIGCERQCPTTIGRFNAASIG